MTWTQVYKVVAADGAEYDYFGSSVAIFGGTAIIGSTSDDDKGTDSGIIIMSLHFEYI